MSLNSASGDTVASPKSRPALSNLVQRVLSALVLFPLLLLTVWIGGLLLTAVTTVAALLALHELYRLFAHTGYRPRWIGYLCTVLFILSAALAPRAIEPGLVLLVVIVATLVVEILRHDHEGSLLAWALTLSGAIYVGWTFAHLILLRAISVPLRSARLEFSQLDSGTAWIVAALLITFASDTVAYFAGRAFGRHRMTTYISPNKTWEGAAGGLLGSVVVGILLVPLLGLPMPIATGAFLGAIGSIAGQAGDLAESLIKRQVGIKDSGNIIPGHGGILDRADSLLFTVPAVYYLAHWLTV